MESIRKFGLEYCDLPTMLSNISTMFRCLALDVDPRDKPVTIWRYILLFLTSACYYYIYLVSMTWFVFVRCKETGDLLSAIVVFSLGVSSEISMTKLICMFVQRKSVRTLISVFLERDAKVDPSSRLAANLKPTLRAVKKRAMIVWSIIIWNGIIYVAIPLMRSEKHHLDEKFEFYGFENMENMKLSPNYEIAYIIDAVAVYITCFPAGNVTSFLIIISGYIEAQMLALSVEITNVWDDALRYYNNNDATIYHSDSDEKVEKDYYEDKIHSITASSDVNSSNIASSHNAKCSKINQQIVVENNSVFDKDRLLNDFVSKRLKDIAKIHAEIINLLHLVEGIYKIPMAIEFLLLLIALIAELLGGLENTYIELPFAVMAVTTDCISGQRVKDASTTFEKAVYNSKWENFDVDNRRMILLMLRSSQKEIRLSAGGIATLDLECLMELLRSTYSAYTTLRSTMKET